MESGMCLGLEIKMDLCPHSDNENGNGSAPLRNNLNFCNRKRKYEQIKNESVNVGMSALKGMNKRVKFEMKTEPNLCTMPGMLFGYDL